MPHTVQNIFHRGALVNGQTPQAVAYTPQQPQQILISNAKELVIVLLASKEGKNKLLSIANEFENTCCRILPGTNPVDPKNLVKTFIDAMSSEVSFPAMVADDAYAANMLGGLSRGSNILGEDFHFNKFEILINRPRVEQMVEAHRTGNAELSVYQFQLACTTLRCVGQIFSEYLVHCMYNGHSFDGATEVSDMMKVAGQNLESGIFGSPIDWFKDPSRGDPQPGQPFRVDTDDKGRSMSSWTPVDMNYIHKLVGRDYVYPAVAFGPIIIRGDREPLFN